MTFTQLEIFAKVAELGGFTAAAEQLGISQSAVSHALGLLEKEWGVTLLSRKQSNIEVTEIGRNILIRVRELLGVSEAIRQEVAAVRGLSRGVLRVGSFGPSSSLWLLPKILGQFQKDFPEIDVIVDEADDDDVVDWIMERRVDVGFVVLPEERLDTMPLVQDQFVALIPANHPLAKKKAVSLPELCESPYIMRIVEGRPSPAEKILTAANMRPAIKHRYSQIITIIKSVENGDGVSMMSDLALSDQVMAMCPGVIKKPFAPAIRRSVGLAVHSLKHASPAASAFLKTAKALAVKLRKP